jgi:hypothetical protein
MSKPLECRHTGCPLYRSQSALLDPLMLLTCHPRLADPPERPWDRQQAPHARVCRKKVKERGNRQENNTLLMCYSHLV